MSKLESSLLKANQAGQKYEEPNKEHLWGLFRYNQTWREMLARKATHQALDIPLDDMEINNTRSGFGWKELAVLGAAGLGGLYLFNQQTIPAPQQVSVPDTEYDVRFYDQHGELIDIPRK